MPHLTDVALGNPMSIIGSSKASHQKLSMSCVPRIEAPNPSQTCSHAPCRTAKPREEEHGGRNNGLEELKFNVLTVVCLATDFAQHMVVPEKGRDQLSQASHAVWTRPYGAPKIVFMDAHQINLPKMSHNGIQLWHAAADSHWQLGLEIANCSLRDMARRAWQTTSRPAPEVIEAFSSVSNSMLRKSRFSPAQWFLGQDTRHARWLIDVEAQHDSAVQSPIVSDPSFQAKMHLRETAAKAFHEAHAKDVWRRAIAGRNRPLRGPYQPGQLVYIFRRRGKGQLTTRNEYWSGPLES